MKHRNALFFIVSLLLVSFLNFQVKSNGSYPPPSLKLWSDDSYWYMSIKDNPIIYPNNDEMIDWLLNNHADYPTTQWVSWTNVVYDCYEDTSLYSVYNEADSRYESIPFPDPYPIDIPLESDHAVTIIDWYREKVWDIWNVRASGGTYIAGDAWEVPLYGSGLDDTGVGGEWTCGGSGCPSVAYLIRPEEIEAGVINHAIGCALRSIGPYTDGSRFDSEEGFVHPPAVHTDRETTSSNPYQIPAGARIQLDPSINLDVLGLSTTGKIVARALQDYGMVVAESGGSWHIYAEHDYTADWNPPTMSGGLLSAIAGLVTPSYKPWRIIDFVLYPQVDDNLSEYESPSPEEPPTFVPWSEDFEIGNLSRWTGTSGITNVTSTYSYEGTYSANLTTNSTGDGENWLTGWDKRVKLTLDHNDFDETLTNFPLYLHICGASAGRYDEDISFVFDEVGSNSRKIAVTTSDGETELYGDIELWDSSAECSRMWVKVPSISNTTDTILYLYYDNDHADNPNINDSGVGNSIYVWDSDFMMVQHMTGASYSALDDSTANNNDVTAEHGTPVYNQAGRCAKAVDFESWSNEYLNVTDDDTLDGYTVGMTLEAWVKLESNGDRTIFGKYEIDGDQRAYFAQIMNATRLEFYFSSAGTQYCGYHFSGQTYSVGIWYYLVFEWISDQAPKAYCNGVALTPIQMYTSNGWTTSTIHNSNRDLILGSKYDSEDFDGLLDEMRISDIARSEAWIKACYDVEKDGAIDWFTEEVGGGGGTPSYIYHSTVSMDALYMCTRVRFEDLPDSNHTTIKFIEFQTSTGTLIGNAMIYRQDSTYYWAVQVAGEPWYGENQTQSTINADTWYHLELYVNSTVNGNIILWLNENLVCSNSGDYSTFGSIEKVVLFAHLGGNMSSTKTVYFDNFEVNDQRIYSGGTTGVLFLVNTLGYGLSDVKINGTHVTDANGYYEWANITTGLHTFVVELPSGYYPAWIFNVNNRFYWNGTHYIITHNVTIGQALIRIYFHDTQKPYISDISVDGTLTTASYFKNTMWGDEYDFTIQDATWIAIHTALYNEEPFLCGGSNVVTKTYNATTHICNMTITGDTTIELLFDRPTPSQWGNWWS